MTTFTRDQVIALATWIKNYKGTNWGGWDSYPSLPIRASYLQFDVQPMQINLDEPVIIDGQKVDCIIEGRAVVGKRKYPLYTDDLCDIAFPDQARARLLEGYRSDWQRAKLHCEKYAAAVKAYESASDEVKKDIASMQAELAAIKGTANSRKRCGELNAALAQLPVVPAVPPQWMSEAASFSSADEYVSFKLQS